LDPSEARRAFFAKQSHLAFGFSGIAVCSSVPRDDPKAFRIVAKEAAVPVSRMVVLPRKTDVLRQIALANDYDRISGT
jgi:hypothetical protein